MENGLTNATQESAGKLHSFGERLKATAAITGVGYWIMALLLTSFAVWGAFHIGRAIGIVQGRNRFQREHTDALMGGLGMADNVVPLRPRESGENANIEPRKAEAPKPEQAPPILPVDGQPLTPGFPDQPPDGDGPSAA